MMERRFEWDRNKAESNYRKHGIDFDLAITAFDDPLAIDELQDEGDLSEERSKLIGMAGSILIALSIRRAAKVSGSYRPGGPHGKRAMTTTVRVLAHDGQVFEVASDGSRRRVTPRPARDLTEDEVMAAALSDPDNLPLELENGRRPKRLAKAKRIRWALGLSREAFAERYRIPLELLTAWERHEAAPDAMANAYLDVIAAVRSVRSGRSKSPTLDNSHRVTGRRR